ncbi:MAG: flippase, partial [Anaerolineae bacterium]|nr:flippase [Anaerolineae bacterium]
YAILYYGFPGINQLHSPFRWIFGVTVGVALLAGFGADALASAIKSVRLTRVFGFAGVISGSLILIGLLVTRLLFPTFEPLIQRLVDNLAQADQAFNGAKMFYSYQFVNVAMLGLMLLGVGIVFLWAGRQPESLRPSPTETRFGRVKPWQVMAIVLVAVDLMAASWSFNPASDPLLLDFTPPAIQWLKQQPGEWRYTTIDTTTNDDPAIGDRGKIMNANMGWRYGLDDIRGYESIIPKQYVDFMSQLAPQVQLDYNRVAPLYTDKQYANMGQNFSLKTALESPLLKLLNVRYVMTSKQFTMPTELTTSSNLRVQPSWHLAYEDEAVRIWEHSYSPRAYVAQLVDGTVPTTTMDWIYGSDVTIKSDSGREKIIQASVQQSAASSWLVLSETYLSGWRAFARPLGGSKDTERPLEAIKVMDNFIGVDVSPAVVQKAFADIHDKLPDAQRTALDNGQLELRVSYSPPSFQIGLFASFISGILLIFMGGIYLWRLFVSAGGQTEGVQVVARNSLAPIILNLFNRGIDFGFAFIMLRILGPEGSGIYTYAGFIFGWFDIFTNFGLNVFLTREVARDPSKAWRYFYNTSVLRLLLMLVGVVLLLGFLSVRQGLAGSTPLTQEALIAIGLLYIGLLPNSLSTGMSALFYAFQQAEYPAAISTIATICKVIFGLAALVLGYGVIGLAAASIVTNTITLVVMVWVGRGLLRDTENLTQGRKDAKAQGEQESSTVSDGVRSYKPDRKLIRGMVGEGWPLMLNHFLATIFFQIDVVIIQYFQGDTVVGQYGVAYKWVNALNVIPAFFTMALLPVMSRQAHEDKQALKRNYGLAIKLLVSVALPVSVVFTALAFVLTGILGGSQFLPDGAIATQLMIWSIPIGWINSLTQYVLIALDLQRRISRAFVIAVSFNIISNLIFIPLYSYRAAAVTTILSELALLIPFAFLLQGAVGRIEWVRLLWKPVVATGAMVAVVLLMAGLSQILAVIAGSVVYLVILLALKPLDAEELERLAPILPFKRLTQKRSAENAS